MDDGSQTYLTQLLKRIRSQIPLVLCHRRRLKDKHSYYNIFKADGEESSYLTSIRETYKHTNVTNQTVKFGDIMLMHD